jgi:hypothetical protein
VTDDDYSGLVRELEKIILENAGRMSAQSLQSHDEDLWDEPGLSVSVLLWDDLLDLVPLPDETVCRLWEIGYALGYDPEFLVSRDGLSRAREGRRTRPSEPVRWPLRGGGHGAGRGLGGKTEFPERWTDEDALDHAYGVARDPDGAVTQLDGTFRAWGVRDGVDLRVVLSSEGEVLSAYPVGGDGVVTNPLDAARAPYVSRLQALLDATDTDLQTRTGLDELMAAGEWDQVVQQLRVLPVPADRRDELAELGQASGLDDGPALL